MPFYILYRYDILNFNQHLIYPIQRNMSTIKVFFRHVNNISQSFISNDSLPILRLLNPTQN